MRTLLALAAALLFAVPTQAGVYVVEAAGSFTSLTEASPISLPSAPFKFVATITAPVPNGTPAVFSNASYELDGALVVAPFVTDLYFYSSLDNGLFDIIFSGNYALSLLGPQIFDASGELIPGVYQTSSILTFPFSGAGSATVTVRPLNVVPEPSTLAGAGLAVIGGIVAVRRRRVRIAA